MLASSITLAYDSVEQIVAEKNPPADKTYIIGTDGSFAPFSFYDTHSNSLRGVDIDLMSAIAQEQGFKYKFVRLRFTDLLVALDDRKLDGVLDGISYTPERGNRFTFSKPYFISGTSIVTKDIDQVKSFKDLYGKTAATKKGTLGEYLTFMFQDKYNLRIKRYNTSFETMLAVNNGLADFVLEEYAAAVYSIDTGLYPGLTVAVPNIANTLFSNVHFITKKGYNSALIKDFNEGLSKILANGKYDQIMSKHFGNLFTHDNKPRTLITIRTLTAELPGINILRLINARIQQYYHHAYEAA